MTTLRQDKDMGTFILDTFEFLWDGHSFNVTVDAQRMLAYIAENFNPEEIFTNKELSDWANKNGFVEK